MYCKYYTYRKLNIYTNSIYFKIFAKIIHIYIYVSIYIKNFFFLLLFWKIIYLYLIVEEAYIYTLVDSKTQELNLLLEQMIQYVKSIQIFALFPHNLHIYQIHQHLCAYSVCQHGVYFFERLISWYSFYQDCLGGWLEEKKI